MKKNVITMKRLLVATGVSAALLGLQGCDADDPDMGTPKELAEFQGKLIDGYLAGATIYLDLNNNSRLNAGEPNAITDQDGYFSQSKDGVDYCREGAPDFEARHCLRTVVADSSATIRTFGGFDITTGEPFTGSLARNVSVGSSGVVNNAVVTPLTTAVAAAENPAEVLDALGITEEDLDTDFLSEEEFSSELTGKALAMHKVATVFSELIDEVFDEFGEELTLPSNSYNFVYQGLVANQPADGEWSTADLLAAFDAAEQAAADSYAAAEISNIPSVSSTDRFNAVEDAVIILGVIETTLDEETTFEELEQNLLGVELVTSKIVYEDASDEEVAEIVEQVEDPNSDLNTLLADEAADFQGLLETEITEDTNFSEIVVIDPQDLTSPMNKQLSINYADDETTGAFHIFFSGTDGAVSGTLVTCLNYESTNSDLNQSEYDIEDVNSTGSWFNIDSNSMVLSLTLGGGNYDVVLSSKGLDEEQLNKYSFSYGGENVSWTSINGLISNDDANAVPVPATDSDCAAVTAN